MVKQHLNLSKSSFCCNTIRIDLQKVLVPPPMFKELEHNTHLQKVSAPVTRTHDLNTKLFFFFFAEYHCCSHSFQNSLLNIVRNK